ERGVVGNGDGPVGSEATVELDDDDRRTDDGDRFPDPVVVPVDVDRKDAYVTLEAPLRNQLVDRLAGDERFDGPKVVAPGLCQAAYGFGRRRVGFDDDASPVSLSDQEPRVALLVVLNSALDERLGGLGDLAEEMGDDPVLVPLREHPDAVVADVRV